MPRVTVPATSANLGPGFDVLGLAVDLRLTVTVTPSRTDRISYRGEGAVPDGPDNLVHQGFRAAYRAAGGQAPTVTFEVDNPIPLARGLGSSSAALVAGAALADELMGGRLGRDEVFRLTAAIEGHPDNVAPAVYGGFTVSAADESGVFHCAALTVPPQWRLLFGVPAYPLATSTARAAVPTTFSRQDTILTSSRAALWVAAVATDRPCLLRTASLDVLHQPYRAHLLPGFKRAILSAREAGADAVFLSGAGPTLALICSHDAAPACRRIVADFAGADGRVLDLKPATGYSVR